MGLAKKYHSNFRVRKTVGLHYVHLGPNYFEGPQLLFGNFLVLMSDNLFGENQNLV